MCVCVSLQSEVILTFDTPNYVVVEGDIVTVTLESNVEIQRSFEVNVSTVDGTAKGEGEFPWLYTSSALSPAPGGVCMCPPLLVDQLGQTTRHSAVSW